MTPSKPSQAVMRLRSRLLLLLFITFFIANSCKKDQHFGSSSANTVNTVVAKEYIEKINFISCWKKRNI